jgi:hypothetical protein
MQLPAGIAVLHVFLVHAAVALEGNLWIRQDCVEFCLIPYRMFP